MITIFKLFEWRKENMEFDPDIPRGFYQFLGEPKDYLVCVYSIVPDFTVGKKYPFSYIHSVNPNSPLKDEDWEKRTWEYQYYLTTNDDTLEWQVRHYAPSYDGLNRDIFIIFKNNEMSDGACILAKFTSESTVDDYKKRTAINQFDL